MTFERQAPDIRSRAIGAANMTSTAVTPPPIPKPKWDAGRIVGVILVTIIGIPVGLVVLIINLGDLVGVSKDRDWKRPQVKVVHLGQAGPLTYEQMARTPDKFNGRAVCLTGGVIQVLDSGGNDQTFRIDITKNKYDRWDDTVISSYTRKSPSEPHVFEHDIINFCGTFNGPYQYKTILGADVTVPRVDISEMRSLGKSRLKETAAPWPRRLQLRALNEGCWQIASRMEVRNVTSVEMAEKV